MSQLPKSDSNKIIFVDGPPGVGKSTFLKKIENNNILVINEILDVEQHKNSMNKNQDFYMQNDQKKYKRATDSQRTAVIDRSAISTLAYNLLRHKLDPSHNFMSVLDWFEKELREIYQLQNVHILYLNGDGLPPYSNSLDPYGSKENLELLNKISLTLIEIFGISSTVVEYDHKSEASKKELYETFNKLVST